MASKATAFKEEGNKRFGAGDFKGAEELYSKAIQQDSTNPFLWTNRAFARIRLSSWDACITDCLQSIDLLPHNMKAYYYLAQAQLAMRHPNEALSSALTAYEICIQKGDSSAGNISALVLRAKKEKWEAREKERIRRRSTLLAELEERLAIAKTEEFTSIEIEWAKGELSEMEAKEAKNTSEESYLAKIEELRNVFAIADPENATRREVPEYLIDNISFGIMHDPVVTKTGQSYDRATILEHLRRSSTDPLTREALKVEDLRTNVALRSACEEFLTTNGWAVDW
ncbi:MAG: hypothetical protein M1827_003940 [Pycnora praestabilis]|nr:MAG: hypothetical protein M1827_003940 [Pycnora praestabilis]